MSTVFSLVLHIFPRWRPDAIKGGGGGGRGGEEDENKPTNYPNDILPDFHGGPLVSHFYEQGKEEKPLDETKMAKLLHRFDNMLTGLTEWSKRVYTPSLSYHSAIIWSRKKKNFHA